jgi:hypothetical protein
MEQLMVLGMVPGDPDSAAKAFPNLKDELAKEKVIQETAQSKVETLTDVDINTSDTSTPTHNQISGPITQARACQRNNQVSSFLASYSSYIDN